MADKPRPKRQRRGIGRTDQRSQMMNGTASLFDAAALGNDDEEQGGAGKGGEQQRPPAETPAQGPPTDAAAAAGGDGVQVKNSGKKGMCAIL